jgi:hypothetical protein
MRILRSGANVETVARAFAVVETEAALLVGAQQEVGAGG